MYGYSGGFCDDPCGFGHQQHGYPSYVAGAACGKGFALIVVLFILLIIVGASKFHG